MSPELAAMSAQFCSSVTSLFNTLSGAFTQLSGMNWSPPHGRAFAGGDYTVCVGGTRGVFVETAKAIPGVGRRAVVRLLGKTSRKYAAARG
jgi:roadblock/LC7 domain-containing protein